MKFDVYGVFKGAVSYQVDSPSQEEAIKAVKKRVQETLNVDWIEWDNVSADERDEYKDEVFNQLKILGYPIENKPIKGTRFCCSGRPTKAKRFNFIGIYVADFAYNYSIYFMVIDGLVYIPISQKNFCVANEKEFCAIEGTESLNNVLSVFWAHNGDIFIFANDGALLTVKSKHYPSRSNLGLRIDYIILHTGESGFFVIDSKPGGLKLRKCYGELDFNAVYDTNLIVPCELKAEKVYL